MIVTCEHGGNQVPRAFARLFHRQAKLLASHRGFDPGSLDLAREFSRRLAAPLFFARTTRLFVELNRSLWHPRLFSELTDSLDPATKSAIVAEYYEPYRARVENAIGAQVAAARFVWHLSMHTFTPVFQGVRRRCDVGLLYDPARPAERKMCKRWQESLRRRRPDLTVRRNYPYLGKTDGFTTHLRRRFPDDAYAGIELEVNQLWPKRGNRHWRPLQQSLCSAFMDAQQEGA